MTTASAVKSNAASRACRIVSVLAVFAALFPFNSHAGNLGQIGTLSQSEFLRISADLGAAAAYKGVMPATSLGVAGFDIGAEITQTQLENTTLFRRAGAGDIDSLFAPKLHVAKGLPFNVDIGAVAGKLPGVDGSLIGAELRYAVLDDGIAMPALGVRVSGTRLSGVGNLSLSTLALDAILSKKLALVTPYAGAGTVRARSKASVAGLREETFNKSRVFVGLNANVLISNVAVEAEKMGDNTSLTAKVGIRF